MMVPFHLWMHSIHGSSVQGLSPVRIQELGRLDSVVEKFSVLHATVRAVSELSNAPLHASIEVHISFDGLCVIGDRGEVCLRLPLASSVLVHREGAGTRSLDGSSSAVGLMAFSSPVVPQAFAWRNKNDILGGVGAETSEHTWILVVTSTTGFNLASTDDAHSSVLQMALEELGARGAIRGDMVGLRPSNGVLGDGSFGSVQLWRRDLPAWSGAVAVLFSASSSVQDRGHLRPATASGTNLCAAIAAKVVKHRASSDQDFDLEQICNEASYLIAIQGHPNVPQFIGVFFLMLGESKPTWVLMMQAYENGNLRELITAVGGLAIERSLKYLLGLLKALAHIHTLDIIHRDVKSENMLLDAGDGVVLVDFGIAAHTSQKALLARKCGTPGSIAPEYLRCGECTVKGDVFAAGIVFYEALSGVRPLDRDDKETTLRANRKAKISYDMDCFSRCCARVRGLLRMMLSPSSQRRHSSVSALHVASRLNEKPKANQVEAVHVTETRELQQRRPAAPGRDSSSVQENVQAAFVVSGESHTIQRRCAIADVPGVRIRESFPRPPLHEKTQKKSLRDNRLQRWLEDQQARPQEKAELTQQQNVSSPSCGPSPGSRLRALSTADSSGLCQSTCTGLQRHEDFGPRKSFQSSSEEKSDEVHLRELLLDYHRQFIMKNGASCLTANVGDASKPMSSSASSSSRSPCRSPSHTSDPYSGHVVSASPFGDSNYPSKETDVSRMSLQSDDEEFNDRSFVVSSMSSSFSFETDMLEEWCHADFVTFTR
eukprot:TRINITY_DN57678_c0_g1_i1.p1 TRINITY_DN57678_c0_g1~~TRINITY_DN57678_c0_g1_i1.p1  ORF type:complete len:772 (-),score=51.96 TRINITY_DN57678_c0_g1_i1:169-2484(-)